MAAKRGAALGIHGVLTQCTLHGTVPIAMAPPHSTLGRTVLEDACQCVLSIVILYAGDEES